MINIEKIKNIIFFDLTNFFFEFIKYDNYSLYKSIFRIENKEIRIFFFFIIPYFMKQKNLIIEF